MRGDLPGYDAWLERPYVEAAKRAERYEAIHEALAPPHAPLDDCPRCAMQSILHVPESPECFGCTSEQPVAGCPLHFPEAGTLYCDGCNEYILRDEEPTYDPDGEHPRSCGCRDCEPDDPRDDEPPRGWEP